MELKPWEKMSPERWRKIVANRRLPAVLDTPESRAQLLPAVERAVAKMKARREEHERKERDFFE